MQKGKGQIVDPLQTIFVSTHRDPFFTEGRLLLTFTMVLKLFNQFKGKVQKLKDRQFGKVQLFVPHKNPTATIGNYLINKTNRSRHRRNLC